jgi:hypothetical protein
MRIVSLSDPAIDIDAMGGDVGDLSRYLHGRDPSLVRVRAGERPTWFTIGDIPSRVFLTYVAAAPDEGSRLMRAFEVGVTLVEDAPGEGGARIRMEPEIKDVLGSGSIRMRWSDAQIDALPPAYVLEAGAVAFARAHLGKAGVNSWPVPPLLGPALAARVRLYQPADETAETTEG